MWLPPDLVELCHSITNSDRDAPSVRTQQSNRDAHQHTMPPQKPREESRNQSAQHTTFPILQLPMDILAIHLPLHLPYDSLVSLRLSNRNLYTAIPAAKRQRLKKLSECERKAVLTAVEEREEHATRRCCVICRSWYPIALFSWVPDQGTRQGDHRGNEGDMSGQGHVTVDGRVEAENRVCRWHRARFERRISRLASGRNQLQEGWTVENACMHCGGVLTWGRCGCKASCPSCWKREVWCYTRIIN